MESSPLRDSEFQLFKDLMFKIAGIHFSQEKKVLVGSRLAKRLLHHNLSNYGDYYQLLVSGRDPDEMQKAVDLLTTNETYFFREPKHFAYLRDWILAGNVSNQPFRVWSAASSTGQEAFSVAMLLADLLKNRPWEIIASDLSTKVLEKCKTALYPVEQAEHIPKNYLQNFCLKGTGPQDGFFLMDNKIRSRVTFMHINLNQKLPPIGEFDLVLLRNVMIYFNVDTKRQVVERIAAQIKPGGHLFIGHSENLHGIVDCVKSVAPAIYRVP